MNKRTTVQEAVSHGEKDGDVLMIGGFLQGGCPETLVKALVETQVKDFDDCFQRYGHGGTEYHQAAAAGTREEGVRYLYRRQSRDGTHGSLKKPASVELNPQGTLAERIRRRRRGHRRIFDPRGRGKTIVERGRDTVMHNGREYLFEEALHGDVAFVRATIVDEHGNCFMRGTTKNFNAIMPAACKYVVVEAEKIVPAGELDRSW